MDRSVAERGLELSLAALRQQVVGRWTRIKTPFGARLLTCADVAAPGRYLHFVDAWMQGTRPWNASAGNASSSGRMIGALREHAHALVRRGVSAGPDHAVVFAGTEPRAPIDALVELLGWRAPDALERPVVFLGPCEHEASVRPWLDANADVVEIGIDAAGGLDLGELDARLAQHPDRRLRAGCFAAASSATGTLCDVRAVARLLHRHGALAFFDYSVAGPHLPIDLRASSPDERVDALFLAMQRFPGGAEGSGVLVVHRSLLASSPSDPPATSLVADLRTGAAFLVQEMLGQDGLLQRELRLARRSVARLAQHPQIEVLGPEAAPRLAVLAVRLDRLHPGFAVALLEDLFGIQSRCGWSSVAAHGDVLLRIDPATTARLRRLVERGVGALRPGWVHVGLPSYFNDDDVEFVLSALEFVARNGEAFLPLYRLSWRDGSWRHVEDTAQAAPALELTPAALEQAKAASFSSLPEPPLPEHELRAERKRYFDQARDLAVRLAARWRAMPPAWNRPTGDPEIDALVGFRYALAEEPPRSSAR